MKCILLHIPNAYRFRNVFSNGLKYSEETDVDGEFSYVEVVLVKNMMGLKFFPPPPKVWCNTHRGDLTFNDGWGGHIRSMELKDRNY